MNTADLFKYKTVFSLEVFPPKRESSLQSIYSAFENLKEVRPDYISVTYGAGGSSNINATANIADRLVHNYGYTAVAHLAGIGLKKADVEHIIDNLLPMGVNNILALRGDRPKDFTGEPFTDFHYATELISKIREYTGDYFCIGGACYPEGHPECDTKSEDIEHLKEKVEAGCEFLTTQMFFDNNIYYNFLYKIRDKGINVPVTAGIMPITRATQVANAISMSGSNMPERFKNLVDHFGSNPAAMQQAGIAYATDQIIDLVANGVKHIHVYSMNKPEVVSGIMNNLSEIMK